MLPDETRPPGAEGEPERELALALRHARNEQVDDVRAADEEEESRCGEEHHERRPYIADELIAQRNDVRVVDPRLVAVALLERLRDRARLPPRLRERYPLAQSADDVPVVRRSACRHHLELARRPELGPRWHVGGGRHDANDAIASAIEVNPRLECRRRPAEGARPEAVADDPRATGAYVLLLGEERSPERWLETENAKEFLRCNGVLGPHRVAGADDGRHGAPLVELGERGEGAALVAHVDIVRIGEVELVPLLVDLPHEDDAIGIGIGQGPEQDAIDDAEDRRRRANPEAQRRDDDEKESRRAGQGPPHVAEVTSKGVHSSGGLRVASGRCPRVGLAKHAQGLDRPRMGSFNRSPRTLRWHDSPTLFPTMANA